MQRPRLECEESGTDQRTGEVEQSVEQVGTALVVDAKLVI